MKNCYIFLIFAVVMKIFTSAQIKELDRFTIEKEPIPSIDLMERAAKALTRAITETWNNSVPVIVFAGPGNNGGDALAVARLLADQGYQVSVYLFNITGHLAEECAANKLRLTEARRVKNFTEVSQEFDPPRLEKGMLVIDGLFGSGLNKPLAGGFASLVKYINSSTADIVAIDVPSGLMTEDNTYNVRANIIRANATLTLQQPKLAFYFPENQPFIGQLRVLDIRLSQEGIDKIEASYSVMEEAEVRSMLLGRDPFAHKGQMGHGLLITGSYGMAGAAILTARACLRSGVRKVTIRGGRVDGKQGLSELFAEYYADYLIQAVIRQHADMAVLNPSSINTIRVVTYRNGMEILPVYTVIRIGRKGMNIDNESAGGISAIIKPDGTIGKYAYGAPGVDKVELTDTGVRLEGYKVPSFFKALELVKQSHIQLPYFNLIGWDIAIEADGQPVMIELNLNPDLSQSANGPAFGEHTEMILKDAMSRANTWTPMTTKCMNKRNYRLL